jgi:hypothetical protein
MPRCATERRPLVPALLLLLLQLGCGAAPPTIPTGTIGPPVTPTEPLANLAGTWTGTVESANFPTRSITLVVVQALNCVDGFWQDASGDWKGSISGFAAADSFSGQISLERTANGGGRCQASANVNGPAGGDSFRWTAEALSAPPGNCTGDLPQGLTLSVRRQQ